MSLHFIICRSWVSRIWIFQKFLRHFLCTEKFKISSPENFRAQVHAFSLYFLYWMHHHLNGSVTSDIISYINHHIQCLNYHLNLEHTIKHTGFCGLSSTLWCSFSPWWSPVTRSIKVLEIKQTTYHFWISKRHFEVCSILNSTFI